MILSVEGKRHAYLSEFTINEYYNSICGTFSIKGVRNVVGLLGKKCQLLFDDGSLIMDAYINKVIDSDNPNPEQANVFGKSEAGILGEVHIARDDLPYQVYNQNLEDIIRKYTGRYEFGYRIFESDLFDSLAPFDEVISSSTETLDKIISKLAIQRGLFCTHAADGTDSTLQLTGRPLAASRVYNVGQYINDWQVVRDIENMHSDITIELQADGDNDGETLLVKNDRCPMFKPWTVVMRNGNVSKMDAFGQKVVAAEKLGIEATFSCTRWIPIGNILPFKGERWFIVESNMVGDKEGIKFTYKAVLEEVYR